ncbi:MAG: hypothetical protein K6C95_08460 [Lachnospiraceae bacterium]|nr:hypothetical protein [Lachnospiraceae bacterium]
MKKATVNSNKKIAREFIKQHNPYKKPQPIGYDVRAYLNYVEENGINKLSIPQDLIQRFAKT